MINGSFGDFHDVNKRTRVITEDNNLPPCCFKNKFLKFNRDLNDRVSLCINIFCEVVKCALYS